MLDAVESRRVPIMSDARPYLLITALVFAIVALIHLVRAIGGWAFTIGPYDLPLSVSWVGFVVTGGLAVWSVTLLKEA
jgi:hypothetical protein